MGAAVDYTGTDQHNLNDFDYNYLVGTAWVDRRLVDRLSAHLQGDYAYGWVDGKLVGERGRRDAGARLHVGRRTATRARSAASTGATTTSTRTARPRSFPRRATTSVRSATATGTASRPASSRGFRCRRSTRSSPRPRSTRGTTREGSEYSFRGVGGFFTTETLLPWRLTLRTLGSFVYRGYLNNTELRDRPARRSAADERQAARPGLRRRGRARAPALLGLAARLRTLALHPRRLDGGGVRLLPDRLRRLLHRRASLTTERNEHEPPNAASSRCRRCSCRPRAARRRASR